MDLFRNFYFSTSLIVGPVLNWPWSRSHHIIGKISFNKWINFHLITKYSRLLQRFHFYFPGLWTCQLLLFLFFTPKWKIICSLDVTNTLQGQIMISIYWGYLHSSIYFLYKYMYKLLIDISYYTLKIVGENHIRSTISRKIKTLLENCLVFRDPYLTYKTAHISSSKK